MKKNTIFIFALFFMALSCIQDIPFENPEYEKSITVSGHIATTKGPYSIELMYSAPLLSGSISVQEPITNAVVQVIENGVTNYLFTEIRDGVYQSDATLLGKVNSDYQLVITLEDGQILESTVERMNPVPKIDRISTKTKIETYYNTLGKITTDRFVHVYVDTTFPSDKSAINIKWEISTDYEFRELGQQGVESKSCWIKDISKNNNVVVVNAEEVNGYQLKEQPVFSRLIDTKFFMRYGIQVFQQSISDAAFDFWERVNEESNRSGNVYERPPSRIKGNVTNTSDPDIDILGLFYVTAIDSASVILLSTDVEGAPRPCSLYMEKKDICYNCLLIPNSSIVKPDYWN